MKISPRPILLSLLALVTFPYAANASGGHEDPCCGASSPNEESAQFAAWQAEAFEAQVQAGGPMKIGARLASEYWESSAGQRGIEDPAGVEALIRAARLIGPQNALKATELLETAARWATILNQPETAAHAYLDAGSILINMKFVSAQEAGLLHDWVASAERLAKSPELTDVQRDRILSRIVW